MLLRGDDASVELEIMGYESELADGDRRDLTDWLVVHAQVSDSTGTRTYDNVSLDGEDAVDVQNWLRAAATEPAAPSRELAAGALLQLPEPDVAVQLVARDVPTVTTRWFFHDPTGPLITIGYVTLTAHSVDIICSRAHLLSCADDWAAELTRFAGP